MCKGGLELGLQIGSSHLQLHHSIEDELIISSIRKLVNTRTIEENSGFSLIFYPKKENNSVSKLLQGFDRLRSC